MPQLRPILYREKDGSLFGIIADNNIPHNYKGRVSFEKMSPFLMKREGKIFGSVYEKIGKIHDEISWLASKSPIDIRQIEKSLFYIVANLRLLNERIGFKDKIDVYDSKNKLVKKIEMVNFLGMLSHHRYFVLNGNYFENVFSDKKSLVGIGCRIDVMDFLGIASEIIHRLKLKDLCRLLYREFRKETKTTEDLIFITQNLLSLANIIENIPDKKVWASLIFELIFRKRLMAGGQIAETTAKSIGISVKDGGQAHAVFGSSFELFIGKYTHEVTVSAYLPQISKTKKTLHTSDYQDVTDAIVKFCGDRQIYPHKKFSFKESTRPESHGRDFGS